ncbi:acyltransferase [Cohnella suwonensis]|uniref:Acyltransferase n=1 Tax=Cohnella suwonensis TaxID=696072 RepID=A0ABW0LY68_9BACL
MENYFKHPNALVESTHIGKDTRVWAFAHILPGAVIGENCNINDHTFIENDVVIGNNVTVKSGVYIWDGIRIEDNVFLGPNATFTNDLRPRSKQYPEKFAETYIRNGASIGANATIIAGIEIGEFAMIGAGAVVTRDVPDQTLWYGNPAKFKGYVCKCGEKLSQDKMCLRCNKKYELINEKIGELS